MRRLIPLLLAFALLPALTVTASLAPTRPPLRPHLLDPANR